MSRAEQFIAACTTLPYPEIRDERGETSVPELKFLSARLDQGMVDEAVEYGRGLARHFPDNDLVAAIVGSLLIRQDRVEEVTNLLRGSLARYPRKYRLYSMAGQADMARDRLANASVWWSRSVIAQCEVHDYQVHLPFYHLAHAAIVLEAFHEAEALFEMSSYIEPNAPHFSPTLEERLEPIRYHWMADPLFQVLQHIEATYLYKQG